MSYSWIDQGNDFESYSLIDQQSCCVPSIMPSHASQSFLALPEMPLQHSVSSEIEFLSDFDRKLEDLHAKTSIIPHVQDRDVPQNQGILTETISKVSRDTQLKRRHEVHSISERRRRNRINGKLKTLQELMPHCKKKDRASILDEAAKHIKALQHQIETMGKLYKVEFTAQAQYMSCSGNPGLQFPYVPIQQGAGMCVGCYARCTPFFQFPSPASAVASFCLPTTRPLNDN